MIKFLLFIAVVFAVIWFLRRGRGGSQKSADTSRTGSAPPAPPAPQDMIECPVCHVHLPRTDALPGPDGRLYCCAEHRQRAAG